MRYLTLLLVCALIIVGLPGCNAGPFWGSAVLVDVSESHPLGSNGRPAKIRGSVRWDFVKFHDNYGWTTAGGRLTPSMVGQRIEKFVPRPAPERVGGDFDGPADALRYPDTRTVVCIDPIVVVVTPQPLLVTGNNVNSDEVFGPLNVLKIAAVKAHIGKGYIASRLVPRSAEAFWFSPTLSVAPTPIDLFQSPPTMDLGVGKVIVLEEKGDLWSARIGRGQR